MASAGVKVSREDRPTKFGIGFFKKIARYQTVLRRRARILIIVIYLEFDLVI